MEQNGEDVLTDSVMSYLLSQAAHVEPLTIFSEKQDPSGFW